jgi:hypothetical protein
LGANNALLSLWAITKAATLIGQEFSQLVYVFELLIEIHRSIPYVQQLSEFREKVVKVYEQGNTSMRKLAINLLRTSQYL